MINRFWIAGLCLSLAMCRGKDEPPGASLVLRSYDVPHGSAGRLRSVLRDVLFLGDNPSASGDTSHWIGRADSVGDDRVVVLATEEVQSGVRALVDNLQQHPQAQGRTIELQYWFVVGRPAAKAKLPASVDPDIQPALDEILKTQGPQELTVGDRLRMASLSGEDGRTKTARLEVRQDAAEDGDAVQANLDIRYEDGNHLSTRVRIAPDQTIVLGAAGYSPAVDPREGPRAPPPSDGSTLYYLIRATLPHGDGQHH